MAPPPKSDDETSVASDDTKKTRRPRTRARKPKTEKAEKPKREKGSSADKAAADRSAELPFDSAPAPREESREPQRERETESVRENPPHQPEAREERAHQPPRAENVERHDSDRSGGRESHGGDASNAAGSQPQGADDRGGAAPAPDQPASHQHQPQHHQGQQHHHGNRGDWHGGGHGGGGERGFWKHGKRKRGRHGGGGGGGGGGHWQGREQHPPQPPPPSNAPVHGDLPNPSRFADLAALDALANELASGSGEPLWLHEIYAFNLADLTAYARKLGVTFDGAPNKRQLVAEIFKFAAAEKRPVRDRGHIDQNDRGCFIVHEHVNYRLYPEDAYLPESLVKRYGLKRGHKVDVTIQVPQEGERCPSVVRIDSVMGMSPDEISKVTPFEELVPYYPLKRILLEDPDVVKDVSMRAVDILTPIGFGQRGLIVAPPRTGKTILLQNIANSISANSPEVKLILLLIDERPEEVTDFKRHTKGEVVSSTFDETPESHVHCAEMVIEIARRRIEQGEHVVILLDSITRLARAYNALAGNQGKTMSGGLESNALQKPKRFFGSARNIEGGGSLTIIASALIDTGSRMDEIIFEEFKGTGNSEVHLDRGLVERRIFPAINIDRSGTRKEELLYHPEELQRIYALRRAMQGLGPIESMEMLITRLKKTKSNAEFLLSLAPK